MLLWKLLVLRFDSFHFIYGLRFWFYRWFFFRMSLLRSCFHCTIGLNLSPFAFASTITALVSIFISFRTYFIRCTCVPTFETLMLTNSLRSLSLSLSLTRSVARYRPNNSNNHSNNKNQNALDYKRSEWNANGWQNGISYHRSMMIFGIVFGVKCYRIKMLKTTMVKI